MARLRVHLCAGTLPRTREAPPIGAVSRGDISYRCYRIVWIRDTYSGYGLHRFLAGQGIRLTRPLEPLKEQLCVINEAPGVSN